MTAMFVWTLNDMVGFVFLLMILPFVVYSLARSAWRGRKRGKWVMGTCNGLEARKLRRGRLVEFKLWKVGDKQGDHVYTEDFWVEFNSAHWPKFVAEGEDVSHRLEECARYHEQYAAGVRVREKILTPTDTSADWSKKTAARHSAWARQIKERL